MGEEIRQRADVVGAEPYWLTDLRQQGALVVERFEDAVAWARSLPSGHVLLVLAGDMDRARNHLKELSRALPETRLVIWTPKPRLRMPNGARILGESWRSSEAGRGLDPERLVIWWVE